MVSLYKSLKNIYFHITVQTSLVPSSSSSYTLLTFRVILQNVISVPYTNLNIIANNVILKYLYYFKISFQGFVPAFVRLGPHTIITFLIFEQLRAKVGFEVPA